MLNECKFIWEGTAKNRGVICLPQLIPKFTDANHSEAFSSQNHQAQEIALLCYNKSSSYFNQR